MTLEIGQIVDGKYRIVRLLGEGGMGAVFEGEYTRIRRKVAIKVLNPAFVANEELIARFEREAQAAGQIGNDHILEVLDLGSLPSGERYMVLEYLDGETLGERIKRHGRLTTAQIVPLARQVLSALAAAHDAGIIHRDLKPENIFVLRGKAGRPDFVKLIDFGVSKFANLGPEAFRATRAGTLVGTPAYMSPEQARGLAEADVRSDIYAVGVILYEAITGRLPFEGVESFNDLMFKIALEDPPPPREHVPDLDSAFERIILTAMARDPAKRHPSVDALANALEEWATERNVPLSVVPPRMRRGSIPDDGVFKQSVIAVKGVSTSSPRGALVATMPNETPPAIESPPLDSIDTVNPFGRSKAKTKLIAAGLGAAGVIGLILVTVSLSAGNTHRASGGDPVAPGSAPLALPASSETVPQSASANADTVTPPVALASDTKPAVSVTPVSAARPLARPPGAVTPKAAASAKPPPKRGKSGEDFGY